MGRIQSKLSSFVLSATLTGLDKLPNPHIILLQCFIVNWCSSLGQPPGLTLKHQTRLERPARDKHSSLLRKSVNYIGKKFNRIGPVHNFQELFCFLNFELTTLSAQSFQMMLVHNALFFSVFSSYLTLIYRFCIVPALFLSTIQICNN